MSTLLYLSTLAPHSLILHLQSQIMTNLLYMLLTNRTSKSLCYVLVLN